MSIQNDFQALAPYQGKSFEETTCFVLQAGKWTVLDRNTRPHPDYPEIDVVATDPTGALWWIEAKGSWRGRTPGLIRGDTVKKAVGVAHDLLTLRMEYSTDGETPVPYMIITSHFPTAGTLGEKMLARAIAVGAVTRVTDIGLRVWSPPLEAA